MLLLEQWLRERDSKKHIFIPKIQEWLYIRECFKNRACKDIRVIKGDLR